MSGPEASRRAVLADDAATAALGAALARALPPRTGGGWVLYLQGDLGAGKTTLARGLLRALGVEGPVRSPTYTLVERYETDRGGVLHLDLYRIADPGELDFLGLDSEQPLLWLVEWPERGSGGLPAPDLLLRLSVAGGGRAVELVGQTPAGRRWSDALAGIGQPDGPDMAVS